VVGNGEDYAGADDPTGEEQNIGDDELEIQVHTLVKINVKIVKSNYICFYIFKVK
jgi:hypothetical protein